MLRHEGLWYGLLQPGLLASGSREVIYSSIRFALYPSLRQTLQAARPAEGQLDAGAFMERFGAGLVAGAVGSAIANPCDLLKIRMQAEPGKRGRDGTFVRGPHRGRRPLAHSTRDALLQVLRHEGARGLYRGVSATCLRSALLTAGQLASYDHAKQTFKAHGFLQEGVPLHITASLISGLVAATCCAPADRLKTLLMLQRAVLSGTNVQLSMSFREAFVHVRSSLFVSVCLVCRFGGRRECGASIVDGQPATAVSLPISSSYVLRD